MTRPRVVAVVRVEETTTAAPVRKQTHRAEELTMSTAQMTRQDYELQIDREALGRVAKSAADLRLMPEHDADVEKAKAIKSFLDTPRGKQLYAASVAAPTVSHAEMVRKHINVSASDGRSPIAGSSAKDRVWDEIDALVVELVDRRFPHLTREQALCEIMKTPKGARLYERYVSASPVVR
jgi:hypothetical protein